MPQTSALHQAFTQPLHNLRLALSALHPEALARRSGFCCRRPRKIPIHDFLLALFALATEPVPSLERIAALIGLAAGTTYSKQAFHQRLSSKLQAFLSEVAVALFGQLATPLRAQGPLASFGRVLLQDSTIQSLPGHLAASFPGSANQLGQGAALKIQWSCDLLSGSLLQFSLSGFRRNDQTAAPDILPCLRPGDLILRDLGFFSLPVLAQIHALGAFFLSRWRHGVVVRDPQTKEPIDLLRRLRLHGQLDEWVLLGEQQYLVRLVALPVPQEVANRRRALARRNRDRRCHPDRQRLALMGWSLFVTNVAATVWPPKILAQVYRLRWRIEVIFKSWKSHLRLRELNCRSADLVRLSVLLKLFHALLTTSCFNALTQSAGATHPVSLLRLSRTLAHCGLLVSACLLHLSPEQLLDHLLTNNVFYETRSDRKNFHQLLANLA